MKSSTQNNCQAPGPTIQTSNDVAPSTSPPAPRALALCAGLCILADSIIVGACHYWYPLYIGVVAFLSSVIHGPHAEAASIPALIFSLITSYICGQDIIDTWPRDGEEEVPHVRAKRGLDWVVIWLSILTILLSFCTMASVRRNKFLRRREARRNLARQRREIQLKNKKLDDASKPTTANIKRKHSPLPSNSGPEPNKTYADENLTVQNDRLIHPNSSTTCTHPMRQPRNLPHVANTSQPHAANDVAVVTTIPCRSQVLPPTVPMNVQVAQPEYQTVYIQSQPVPTLMSTTVTRPMSPIISPAMSPMLSPVMSPVMSPTMSPMVGHPGSPILLSSRPASPMMAPMAPPQPIYVTSAAPPQAQASQPPPATLPKGGQLYAAPVFAPQRVEFYNASPSAPLQTPPQPQTQPRMQPEQQGQVFYTIAPSGQTQFFMQ